MVQELDDAIKAYEGAVLEGPAEDDNGMCSIINIIAFTTYIEYEHLFPSQCIFKRYTFTLLHLAYV